MTNERRLDGRRIIGILAFIAVAGIARLLFVAYTDSSNDLELESGLCIKGVSNVENVPCDDPDARYRLVQRVLPLTSFRCDPGHVPIRIERASGRFVGSNEWCAEEL